MTSQLRDIHDHTKFQAELHIQTLRAELFGDSVYEPCRELAFNKSEQVFLSPHERWQRQLKPPPRMSNDKPKPLIWVSGHITRRNVSWVSSFSVDLVSYFSGFEHFKVAYIFCKRGQGAQYTPTLLIKGLIAQLMDLDPIVTVKNLRQLSLKRFRDIQGNPGSNGTTEGQTERKAQAKTEEASAVLAWDLLDEMLRLMEQALEINGLEVLVWIDRLDLCVSEKGFSVLHDLIPRLQNLSHRRARVQVIVTTARLSALAVPHSCLRKGPEWLQAFGKRTHG